MASIHTARGISLRCVASFRISLTRTHRLTAGNLTMAKTLKFASDLSTIFMGAGATLSVLYKGTESTMSICACHCIRVM